MNSMLVGFGLRPPQNRIEQRPVKDGGRKRAALSILLYPFLACILLIMAHAYFGVHILQRGIIFVDLSLAQFIVLGIAFSFFLGEDEGTRLIFSLGFAVLGASILSLSRHISRFVHIEAFIGSSISFRFRRAYSSSTGHLTGSKSSRP